MGVNPLPTGGIYKYFSFDGVTSASFGVHLTGTGVFNAPTRAVEMVNIPARNGAFPQDMGYFENIEVTYTASIVADNETDFADAVSDLRNWLCSRKGYCRLEDDYNPDEYRMAVYKSGLEVEPFRLEQGEFEIVFDCKPQRFLKTGETAIDIMGGAIPTNPTQFDAKPLLQVKGYGGIYIGSKKIEIANSQIGQMRVNDGDYSIIDTTMTFQIDTALINNGDTLSVTTAGCNVDWVVDSGTVTMAYGTVDNTAFVDFTSVQASNTASAAMTNFNNPLLFTLGTSKTITCTDSITITTSAYGNVTGTMVFSCAYNGSDTFTVSGTTTTPSHCTKYIPNSTVGIGIINANSTKSALGNPLYIDLETGEAYNLDYGYPISSNSGVILPAELPVLKPGSNSIAYAGIHFTSIEIVPRWWKV